MSVGPISSSSLGALSSPGSIGGIGVSTDVGRAVSGTGRGAVPGIDFGGALADVSTSLDAADQLATQVATGQIENIHEYTAAATKAQLGVELTVAFQRRAIEAFQEIMRIQI